MHPIWCTPPVRFVDLMLEMDGAALKTGVEDHDVDVADGVVLVAADVAAAAGFEMDVETGELFEVVKETADEVNVDFDGVALDDDLVEVDAEDVD